MAPLVSRGRRGSRQGGKFLVGRCLWFEEGRHTWHERTLESLVWQPCLASCRSRLSIDETVFHRTPKGARLSANP
jgi:hypothetical protein